MWSPPSRPDHIRLAPALNLGRKPTPPLINSEVSATDLSKFIHFTQLAKDNRPSPIMDRGPATAETGQLPPPLPPSMQRGGQIKYLLGLEDLPDVVICLPKPISQTLNQAVNFSPASNWTTHTTVLN
uniref:Uncharacterized protein n=1 Tax=Sphaerodactylus townsendi TaxID=933632 RepID=A0ACB8G4X6_9SAUR